MLETAKNTEVTDGRWGIAGSTLKLIAIVSMFIDHTGAVILLTMLKKYQFLRNLIVWEGFWKIFPWVEDRAVLVTVYSAMRDIGRIAFPIFCFLLVEGFQKTRSIPKYALRLGLFALISEIPFDLAFNGSLLEFSSQNVYFTLFMGLITMAAWEFISQKKWISNMVADNYVKAFLVAVSGMSGAYLAELLHTDYGALGVMSILVLYLFRKYRILQAAAGAVSFCWELPAPLAFFPVLCYNGERGIRMKYVFYLFYPLHLLFLFAVCRWLGIR
ncbi:MAG: conjugal transfer protein TraX [Lachnoclostridium sp.]|nr:conjugal transfer protein TraX [Lachnospira sp.]MCM1247082.1 conjugal transfer protein TraX [Lachnoclostridium sp.]